ncbi:phage minor capsid protein, partial [Priestia megaterium]|uniref:phage minor capsid protein n=1 Tax=Priestia megaterium TaxID=1404 RepID=UPI002E1F726F
MDGQVAKELEKLIKKTFKEGQAYHLLSVKEAKTWNEALNSASFNRIQREKVQALFADTYKDILIATENTSESVKALVRDQVKKVSQYHSLKNTRYTQQAEELAKELSKKGLSERISKEGFVGIEDARGRKWDLKTYSNMVIKTKVNDAYINGMMHESQEKGFDLAVISKHGAKDKCRNWEGMVISLHGKTKGYITYKQARA